MTSLLAYLLSTVLVILWTPQSTRQLATQYLFALYNWVLEFFTKTKITYIHPVAHPTGPSRQHHSDIKNPRQQQQQQQVHDCGGNDGGGGDDEKDSSSSPCYCYYELTPMDCLQAAIPPIAFSLVYEQPIDVAKFQQALQQTLVYFPLLAGRIHRQTTNRQQSPFLVKVVVPQQHHLMAEKKGKRGGYNYDNIGVGGALFMTNTIGKPYPTRDDHRWFPIGTGNPPWPAPHEPHFTYGPLLRIKHTHITSTNSSVLSYGFCHAVMDATSVGSFLRTMQAHYNNTSNNTSTDETKMTTTTTTTTKLVPEVTLERVAFKPSSSSSAAAMPQQQQQQQQQKPAEPLGRFTKLSLIKALPKLIKSSVGMQHLNLTITKTELQRLKTEFLDALSSKKEHGGEGNDPPDNNSNSSNKKWVSTYEMLGVLLLRAFHLSSKDELQVAVGGKEELECRCIVDPRGRDANPYVHSKHQGNVSEMPSIRIQYKHLQQQQQQQQQQQSDDWRRLSLQEFHNQLRTALKDPDQMQFILRSSQASYQAGYLHTTEGRTMSSKIFARNILEPNVCSYNSWLHMDWFDITTLGGGGGYANNTENHHNNNNRPIHFQVSEAMNCQDMFWVFPKTPTEVTIRTTLPPIKAERFLKELCQMNVSFEVQ